MRSTRIIWIVGGLLGLGAVYATFKLTSRSGYESAAYQVEEADGAFEIRRYAALKVVSTEMSFQTQGDDGSFMRLFRFISGGNSEQQKLAMTTPVFMDPASEETAGKMAFVIPAKVAAEGVPEPSSNTVKLADRPAGLFAVCRFSGVISRATVDRQEQALRSWLQSKGYRSVGDIEVAGYDPPWTPGLLRRNEVLLRIEETAT